jgi:hypothetical protein
MSLDENVAAYREICQKIRQLEEEKKALSQVILKEMPTKKMVFPDYVARICKRFSIHVPIEEARTLGAIKMVEQVDRDKIKEMHSSGVAIKGVEEISYLVISSMNASSTEEV